MVPTRKTMVKPTEYYDGEDEEETMDATDDDLSSRKARRDRVDNDEMSPEEEGFLEGAENANDED
jgi:hypothetical protein